MATARDVVTAALQASGVAGDGQTPSSVNITRGFNCLRRMLAAWQVQRYLVPTLRTFSKLATGATSYTVGPGADFDTGVRVNRIASAYVVQNNIGGTPVSLPLADLGSRENYNLLAVKLLQSLPTHYFLDNNWPLGNAYFWPIPTNIYTLYISVAADFAFPANLDDTYDLPAEYEEAIHYNLAKRIAADYQLPLSDDIDKLAKAGYNVIRKANVQVPEMQMPGIITGRRSGFNIYNADGY